MMSDEELKTVALTELRRVARIVDTQQEEVLGDLEDISEAGVESMSLV